MSGAAVETVAPKTRRRFAAAEKLRILKAAEGAAASGERGALEGLLRKEGIYSSLLSKWRQQFAAKGSEGLSPGKPGRKAKMSATERELIALQTKTARLEHRLKVANALIELQKKSARTAGDRAADSSGRGELMGLLQQRDACVSVAAACEVLGLSRATLYRVRRPAPASARFRPRPPSPRRLSAEERQRILDVFHSPEFADQPPAEVYAALLERGEYIASIRTMYRVLAEAGEVRERRNVRAAQVHPMPSLTATAPNQVWTWDITKLATTEKGVFLQAYVIIELFSRFVVGWLLATKQCKHLAATLLAETIARHGVQPGLVVHADRGSAMKSDTVAQLLAELGASRSFSRPRVSDDNARIQRGAVQDDEVSARLAGALHRNRPRAWLAAGVLRLAQRRAPSCRARSLHACRRVPRTRRRSRGHATARARCSLRSAS